LRILSSFSRIAQNRPIGARARSLATLASNVRNRRSACPDNGNEVVESLIIEAVGYAEQRMSMRLGNVRYSACE
jgi:hypothetical protein